MLRKLVEMGGRVGLSLLIVRGLVRPVTPVTTEGDVYGSGKIVQKTRSNDMKPIPGLNVLGALGPKSMYTRGDGQLSGYPVGQGVDQDGYYIVWAGFGCGGKGCPETLVMGDPNGMPTPRSCIYGFEVRDTVDPNYDKANPHSKPTVPRYYATGRNDQCSTLSRSAGSKK